MRRVENIPFAFATIWAIGASLYLLLWPLTITEVIAESVSGTPGTIDQVQRQASWYEVQGIWGVFIVLLFALIFSSTWFFAYRAHYGLVGLFSLIAVITTYLAGFSIGPLYLPSVLAVLAGWLLLGLQKLRNLEKTSSG